MNRTQGWSIIVCCILLMLAVTVTGCETNPIEKLAREQAEEYRYGKNKQVDFMIQVESHAEGWKFVAQMGVGYLFETNNEDVPFTMTIKTHFSNPKDGTTRSLIQTYLYDRTNYDWVPLVASVWEYKTESAKKRIALYRLWQGDYDYIPFFKTHKEWLDELRRLKEQLETK